MTAIPFLTLLINLYLVLTSSSILKPVDRTTTPPHRKDPNYTNTPPTQQITTPSKRPKATTTKSVESISTPNNSSEEQANSKNKSTPTTPKEHYDLRTSTTSQSSVRHPTRTVIISRDLQSPIIRFLCNINCSIHTYPIHTHFIHINLIWLCLPSSSAELTSSLIKLLLSYKSITSSLPWPSISEIYRFSSTLSSP